MTVTASKLRENIYRLLDQVLDTGVPLEVERRGRVLRIVPAGPQEKLSHLVRRDAFLRCDPDEIVHVDWSGEWQP
ncbi:MAG: type II toxin-antitoxin system Phd/YefM family antitoxin [Deltaproteobacteria bacterium]|nr:type II toxin-antitoxin system Phd/YefM family antitoxin [Deltaproteobacteria bacterium]